MEARGEVAELKDNINAMIRNLRATTDQNTEQDWLKTNLAKFTNMLQGQRDLATPGVKDQIQAGLKSRKEQLVRTAYLTAVRTDAKVVNYAARRLLEGNGKLPGLGLATPPAAAPTAK